LRQAPQGLSWLEARISGQLLLERSLFLAWGATFFAALPALTFLTGIFLAGWVFEATFFGNLAAAFAVFFLAGLTAVFGTGLAFFAAALTCGVFPRLAPAGFFAELFLAMMTDGCGWNYAEVLGA